MTDINLKNYEIHDVADTHFLVNVSQNGDVFEKPIEINEFASEVLKHIKDGMSVEETAKCMSLEYEAEYEEILKDMNDFLNVLNEKIV